MAESAGHIVCPADALRLFTLCGSLQVCDETQKSISFSEGVMIPRICVFIAFCLFFLNGCAPEGTPSSSTDKPAASVTPPAPSSFDLRAGDPALKMPVGTQSADGIVSTGKEGALVVGPSVPIQAGKYVARWYGKWGQSSGSRPVVFDVYWDGSGPWPSTNPKPGQMLSAKDSLLAEVPFELQAQASNFQARVWVAPEHKLTITRVEVLPR